MTDAQLTRTAQKDAILEASLIHTAFDGWSNRALQAAGRDCSIDQATLRRLFPRGTESLVVWLDDWLDRQIDATIDIEALRQLPVRRRIAKLVRTRLELLGTHQESMRRLALARGLPQNLPLSARNLWKTADRIWEKAGFPNDQSDGLSRFTRRGLLVGILTSTFFFWLEDMSPDFADTWAFLDRRIDDALKLGRLPAALKTWSPSGLRDRLRNA